MIIQVIGHYHIKMLAGMLYKIFNTSDEALDCINILKVKIPHKKLMIAND